MRGLTSRFRAGSERARPSSTSWPRASISTFTPSDCAPDQARDIILRNVEELTDGKRITTVLQFDGPFKDQIRQILMLEAFVNRPDWSATEQEIVESLTGLEQDVLDAAASEDSLRYEDPERLEILRDVLRAALDDKLITTSCIRRANAATC